MLILWISFFSLCFFVEGVSCKFSVPDDYYGLLEVPRSSSTADIKKNYRKLSKKYHPDKNPGDEEAADHYKNINRAYEVLANEEKRQMFDNGGVDGVEKFEQ